MMGHPPPPSPTRIPGTVSHDGIPRPIAHQDLCGLSLIMGPPLPPPRPPGPHDGTLPSSPPAHQEPRPPGHPPRPPGFLGTVTNEGTSPP